MKHKRKNIFILSAVLSFTSAGANADNGGIGTNFLMSQTGIDPLLKPAMTKPGGKRKQRLLAMPQPKNADPTANTQEFPTQILKTGVSLVDSGLSANSLQLSDNIGLTPVLERISQLQNQTTGSQITVQSLSLKQDLLDASLKARMLVQKASLEIDFTVAEMEAERQVYNEILGTFKNDRDKAVALTNACAFISNGVLWAVTEALFIPPYKYPVYNVPAGIVGIPAGIVPSIASMYTFKLMNGKKKTSEVEPNMLAKVFNYPTNPEIEYPKSVWTFLNQTPAETPNSKTRLAQMVDRWISDANMPAFTDKNSKKQLDVLTASVAQEKGLTIATLTARSVMLDQLLAEVNKMKRMLLELDMVVTGDKRFIVSNQKSQQL